MRSTWALLLVVGVFGATSDGGFLISGQRTVQSGGRSDLDAYLIKTSADGATEWEMTYGGAQTDVAFGGVETASGYLFAGRTASLGAGMDDVYVLVTDKNGDL